MKKRGSDSGDDSGDEDGIIEFMFASALDVGSSFLKVEDEDELTFRYNRHNNQKVEGVVYLENVTPKSTIAFCIWTSSKDGYKIWPTKGFIKPGQYLYVNI